MLKWALIFAILALIAGALGFGGLASGFAVVAKVLFGIFLAVFLVMLLLGITVYRSVT
ncbi:MAG: DUF1328 domain-containing protein [Candidatus Korobacteraceae bacterium]